MTLFDKNDMVYVILYNCLKLKKKERENMENFLMNIREKNRKIIKVLLAMFMPLIIIMLTEYIHRQSVSTTLSWMFENIGAIFLNYLIIYFIFYCIQSIFNKPAISLATTSGIYFILSLISYLKYEIRGEVLLINDFSLASQMSELISFVELKMIFKLPVIVATIFTIGGIIFMHYMKIKTNRKKGLIILGILTFAMYIVFINKYTSSNILKLFGIDTEIRYNINSIHEKEGVILGLYSNILMNNLQEPLGYSKEKVFEILENVEKNIEIEKNENLIIDEKLNAKPNVIMIMSESFFDPTVLENITFSEDPIPNIRKIIDEYTSGQFLSSTFAGGTSNIEFEAFTGDSIAHLPYGTVPYTDLKENIATIDTLPKIMKKNGYKTVAVHTYEKTFYNRDVNYANIGFDEFIGVEDLYEPKYFGKYVSDETFVDNIINILEDNTSEQSTFVWGVTMQNHTPYDVANYEQDLKLEIDGENLTAETKNRLTAYVNSVNESDKAIKKLIDYIENSGTPTVVLFFGDHLPSLYEAYFDAELIHTKDTTKWSTDEMLKLHTIPFFIYDNFDYKIEYSQNEVVGAMFLGNYLCNYLNLEKPLYFKFLDTLDFMALRDRLFVDEHGNAYEKVTQEYKDIVNTHKILQYDSLFGEKYIEEYIKEKSSSTF